MTKITVSPYINFQGRAREALEFYHKVLGGSVDLQALRLELGEVVIVATDGHPKYPAKIGDNIAIAVSGTNEDGIAKIFSALADGGTIKGPLTKQPWGAAVGYLLDKFGINWVVSNTSA